MNATPNPSPDQPPHLDQESGRDGTTPNGSPASKISDRAFEQTMRDAGQAWRADVQSDFNRGAQDHLVACIERRLDATDRELQCSPVAQRRRMSDLGRAVLAVSTVAATALVAFLAATMLKPRLEMTRMGVDPAVVRAIDLAVLPSGTKPTSLDARTCDQSDRDMDPRASHLVHAGAWRVGQCYEPRSFADGTGATLYRPGRHHTAGLVLRSATSAKPSIEIGVTEMRNFVIYDVAVSGMRQFLAVHRDSVTDDGSSELMHCKACHEQQHATQGNPHRMVARNWSVP